MMLANYRARPGKEVYAVDYCETVIDMRPHLDPLSVGKRARFQKYGIPHADLADVMKERTLLQNDQVSLAQVQLPAERQAIGDDALLMSTRLYIPRLTRLRQRPKRR